MRLEKLHAVVLHRRAYRETSYLVDFFTRELGRLSAVCKGARSKRNDKRSLLQPFQPLMIDVSGRHELKNLTTIDASSPAYALSSEHLFSAFYLNELLNRLMAREMPHPEIFDFYLASLLRLSQAQAIEPVLREFEIHLLTDMGVMPAWDSDAMTGQAVDPHAHYTFIHQQGFVAQQVPQGTKNTFAGQLLLDILHDRWHPASLKAAKRITRMALQPLIGDKPLKSRELFLQPENSK